LVIGKILFLLQLNQLLVRIKINDQPVFIEDIERPLQNAI